MANAPELVATLLTHARVRLTPPGDAAALESLLNRAWEAARAQWSPVELPAGLFVRHLAERLSEARPGSSIEALLEPLAAIRARVAGDHVLGRNEGILKKAGDHGLGHDTRPDKGDARVA